MAQFNQQFEKHHIETLRKWAKARGINKARWRSEALKRMVEEAAVEQVMMMPVVMAAIERTREAITESGLVGWSDKITSQDILVGLILFWSDLATKGTPPPTVTVNENPGS